MISCSKIYTDFPFAHRQPSHPGHCRLIHGHNWSFEFHFGCSATEPGTGFVVDFGSLGWLKDWLNHMFDHTLVLNMNDPCLEYLRKHLAPDFAAFRVVPNCSSEGLAAFVFDEVDKLLRMRTNDRVFLLSVIVREDARNSAQFSKALECNH